MDSKEVSSGSWEQTVLTLDDRDLWLRFQALTNEMIVTKSGRRMFPVVKVSIRGLDPDSMYSILLEFVQIEQHRWKYVNGEWVAGGKAEAPPTSTIYMHPESPNFGSHWMKEPVSFAKVKLTNKANGNGQIMLNSLHKYEPRVHVVRVGHEQVRVAACPFPETQFIAVTAYQNEEVTSLKIKYNPFAKAFLDAKERPETSNQREYNIQSHSQTKIALYNPYSPSSISEENPWLMSPGGGYTTCERLRPHRHSPYPPPQQLQHQEPRPNLVSSTPPPAPPSLGYSVDSTSGYSWSPGIHYGSSGSAAGGGLYTSLTPPQSWHYSEQPSTEYIPLHILPHDYEQPTALDESKTSSPESAVTCYDVVN